jgi:membrane protein
VQKLYTTIGESFNFLRYLLHRFNQDRCSQSAAALTYMSLFAIVPLMTVMYSVLAALPAFDTVGEQIQGYVFSELIPSGGAEISEYMHQFSSQAKNLTGIGIGLLVITAILMIKNIEKVFNSIWKTRTNRGGVSSFLLYWAVLSLAPFCIGIALAITTYLASLSVFITDLNVIGIGPQLLPLVPSLMGVAACTLIYATVPYCPVPFKHAVIGGITAVGLFVVAKTLFTRLIVGSSYTFIYGAFAAIPLFLLWLYVSWLIILLGAVLVHSLSSYSQTKIRQSGLLIDALSILHLLWEKQGLGQGATEREIMDQPTSGLAGTISEANWHTVEKHFIERQLIQRSEDGKIFLSRDLDKISLWQIFEWLTGSATTYYTETSPGSSKIPWLQHVETQINQMRENQQQKLDINLADLFSQP